MMAQNLLLKLIEMCILGILCIQLVSAATCSNNYLNITDLTDIDPSGMTNAYGTDFGVLFQVYGITDFSNPLGTPEDKGNIYLDEDVYNDQDETALHGVIISIIEEDAVPNIEAGDYLGLSYDSTSKNIYFPQLDGDDDFYVADDGSTWYDKDMEDLAYGANSCTWSCTAPASGDWTISNDDTCLCDGSVTITGDLILNTGTLNITSGCTLTIQGGEIYMYSSSNLYIFPGGQING